MLNAKAWEFFFGSVFCLGNSCGDGLWKQNRGLANIAARVTGDLYMNPAVIGIQEFKFIVGRGLEEETRFQSGLGVDGRFGFYDGNEVQRTGLIVLDFLQVVEFGGELLDMALCKHA